MDTETAKQLRDEAYELMRDLGKIAHAHEANYKVTHSQSGHDLAWRYDQACKRANARWLRRHSKWVKLLDKR